VRDRERVKLNAFGAVDNLLFPVKLGLHVPVMLGALAVGAMAISCGYQPVYAARSEQPLSVVPGPYRVAELSAVEAALGAARAELSRAGALKPGAGYPRIVVEVLRVDEQSLGIVRVEEQGIEQPSARGSRIAVVGRAWLESGADRAHMRDSGDLRRAEQYASSGELGAEAANRDDAIRSPAKRLGRAQVRRIMGEPEPPNEEL
jgi:hypothetical protein